MRTSFSFSQLETLEAAFEQDPHLDVMRAESLAVLLDMPVESIVSWFAARVELQKKRECRRMMQVLKQLRVLQR